MCPCLGRAELLLCASIRNPFWAQLIFPSPPLVHNSIASFVQRMFEAFLIAVCLSSLGVADYDVEPVRSVDKNSYNS